MIHQIRTVRPNPIQAQHTAPCPHDHTITTELTHFFRNWIRLVRPASHRCFPEASISDSNPIHLWNALGDLVRHSRVPGGIEALAFGGGIGIDSTGVEVGGFRPTPFVLVRRFLREEELLDYSCLPLVHRGRGLATSAAHGHLV